ncbi:MAG: aldo/keto reductase [Acholeplasmatales bacterium]|nr:MAG: aldo/keto reductase [Acholeplasmatales bacterium]
MRSIKLNNGVYIPQVGLGTFRSKDNDAYKAVYHALKSGYRHIDTAAIYANEEEVGRAVRDAGIPREELFITSKVWNDDQGYMATRRALQRSLHKLGLSYLDLYLIHWPKTYASTAETYKALEDLYEEGLIRAIGVSNFTFHHLEHLFETAQVMPQVNQVECHLYLQNEKLLNFCRVHGIHLEAYAPLMSSHVKELLADETLQQLAKKYNKTAAQIALRYLIERELIIIPKSVTPARIEENAAVFDFEIEEDDLRVLRARNRGRRYFPDPDNIGF